MLLAIIAAGLLKAMHQDPEAMVWGAVKAFHFDPGNRHVAALLQKAGLIDGRSVLEPTFRRTHFANQSVKNYSF